MSFITAEHIHDGYRWLPEGSAIEITDDGTIIGISDQPDAAATFYDGILAPGFINAHCHLELSHMKGLVPEHTGLIPFLKKIPLHRNDFTDEQKKAARQAGYDELLRNGIVAVGDIANTIDTLDARSREEIHFYTFVESIGFTEANAQRAFNYALDTYNAFQSQPCGKMLLQQAIIPHAPYSVSASLFRLIDKHGDKVIISIHNQESPEEDKYYTTKEGHVQDLLHTLGIDDSFFSPTGKSSLQSYLGWLSTDHPFLFVHNTYTRKEDIQFAHNRLKEAYWCLCPNANLYIENTLPDIDMFLAEKANICIGTDSLASNHQLSILSELATIRKHFPHIGWETLLTWATANGAKALQMSHIIGSIEPGKNPGILQITDLHSSYPSVKRIV